MQIVIISEGRKFIMGPNNQRSQTIVVKKSIEIYIEACD